MWKAAVKTKSISAMRENTVRVNNASRQSLFASPRSTVSGIRGRVNPLNTQFAYSGSQITNGIPVRAPFFNKVPGENMSASVVRNAANLTIEYH